MRTSFIEELQIAARTNPNIFLITGDLGYSVLEPFANEFPDRFLNAGIAEQNMTGIAAGLALEGYHAFTYSIANFPTFRCLEQIRNDICYHNLNVTVVAVGGGYSYGSLGASHHATEDIGTMRTIPNMRVYCPGDPIETRLSVRHIVSNPGPSYLRLGKAGEPIINNNDLNIDSLKFNCIKKGRNTAVLTTGSILNYAIEDIRNSNKSLYSITILKPFDINQLIYIANNYENVITVEEHQRSAGFGSIILESFNDLKENRSILKIPNIKRLAIADIFQYQSGSQNYLRGLADLKLKN